MLPTKGWITTGDLAPDFELPDQNGRPLRLASLRGTWVVVYFYPSDGSFGCTAEACEFRDNFSEFQKAGAEVLGVSSDDVASHERFARSLQLPYRILADRDEKVRRAWGVPKALGLIRSRITFVVDPLGVVRHRYSSQFKFREHASESLQVLQEIRGGAA